MMDRQQFEREYRQWKREETPELWDRIESQLKEHPERLPQRKSLKNEISGMKRRTKRIYGTAAAAAAAVVFIGVMPVMFRNLGIRKSPEDKSPKAEATAGYEEIFREETEGMFSEEEGIGRPEDALPKSEGEMEASERISQGKDAGNQQEGNMDGGVNEGLQEGWADESRFLELGDGGRLQVPEDAITVPEDASYFSEAILADTELLCTGTVESASLEYDRQGRAVNVTYRLQIEQIHYAQDYVDGRETLLVKSPIIKAEGDEVYVLYQLKEKGTYLLPLKSREGDWELIYPFAPQIEITREGAYQFHSGYASLINQETKVITGIREGENDYFYDRMLSREDSGFLSQFLSLIKREKGGE